MLKASSHQRLVCSLLLLLIAICQCADLAPFPLTNEVNKTEILYSNSQLNFR